MYLLAVITNYMVQIFFLFLPPWQGIVRTPESYKNWYIESLTQRFPGGVIRRFSSLPALPHVQGNSMGEPPLFNFGIQKRWERGERQSFWQDWESNQGPRVQDQVHYPLSYHFTPWCRWRWDMIGGGCKDAISWYIFTSSNRPTYLTKPVACWSGRSYELCDAFV